MFTDNYRLAYLGFLLVAFTFFTCIAVKAARSRGILTVCNRPVEILVEKPSGHSVKWTGSHKYAKHPGRWASRMTLNKLADSNIRR